MEVKYKNSFIYRRVEKIAKTICFLGHYSEINRNLAFFSGITHWKCTVLNALDSNNNILTRQMLEILSDHENAKRHEASNNCEFRYFSLSFAYFFNHCLLTNPVSVLG